MGDNDQQQTNQAADPPAAMPAVGGAPSDDADPMINNVAGGPPYNRAGALAYARKYWTSICSDRLVALAPSPSTGYKLLDPACVFVHEFDGPGEHLAAPDGTTVWDWKPINDCTHFVSCCIGSEPNETGGGLRVPRLKQLGFVSPYGCVGAPDLADWLATFTTVIPLPYSDKSSIQKAKAGDVIGFRENGVWEHMVLYMGNGKIACHTYCRCDTNTAWDNDWNLGEAEGWTATLFQFKDPGP